MSPFIEFHPNPFTDHLKDNWQGIRDEYYHYLKSQEIMDSNNNIIHKKLQEHNPLPNTYDSLYSSEWTSDGFYVKPDILDEDQLKRINWDVNIEKYRMKNEIFQYPNIFYIYDTWKEHLGSIVFNISYPGSRLHHHYGVNPQYIRMHVCIKTEEHCTFDVENHRRGWKDGDVFGFDDAQWLHGTDHSAEGKHERIIVLIDIDKTLVKPWAKTWPVRDSKPLTHVKINPW
jgi:hypothetical protein